jgi:hypothetical protein
MKKTRNMTSSKFNNSTVTNSNDIGVGENIFKGDTLQMIVKLVNKTNEDTNK